MSNETKQLKKEVIIQAPTLLQYLIYVAFSLTVVLVMVGILFSLGEETALVTVLSIMTGVLLLVEALPRVMGFTIGPVKATLTQIEQRQADQGADIEAIRIALRAILMKHEFGPLKALDEAGQADISKGPNLVTYLHKLDGLNFIQPNPGHGLNEIERIRDGETFNLKDYLYITDDGKAYLDITTKLKIFKSGVDWKDPYPWTPLPPSH